MDELENTDRKSQNDLTGALPDRVPEASLIICSRNRPELLAKAVDSILNGREVPSEIVIIDQSDVPQQSLASLQTDRPCNIRYLWPGSVGLSRANNHGIAVAQHNLLVFTHDDVLVTPEWFGTIARRLVESGPNAVVTGRVLPSKEETSDGFVPSTKINEAPAVYKGRNVEGLLYPHNMAMYRSLADSVGSFDVRLGPGSRFFPAAEDNDFCFRVLNSGYRIVYAPDAVLHHRAWRPRSEYFPLRWGYGRGQGGCYAKHLSLRDAYMLRCMAWEIKYRVFRLPRLFSNQPRKACGDVVYLFGLLSGAIHWLLTQRGEP